MIRPYLTVLKDAFHEAFASRVLWIVLAALTVILLAVAPLGLYEERASRLQMGSVRDWPALITQIHDQADAEGPSPGKRIWELSSEEFREAVDEATRPDDAGPRRGMVFRLLGGLNDLLERRDFYEPAAWADVRLDRETKELLARGVGRLSQDDLAYLNGRLLRAAFPDALRRETEKQLRLTYLGAHVGEPLPISLALARPVINQLLAQTMQFFVGTVAVFIAILVTAPMIPHTFEAGAIDLLLSKPVARPLLFLAKFLGGCVFILLNASYFIVGLWLIMGLRFGMWNGALLQCIPLFLFLFAIYYCVSALAGVLWRNAIVAIVVTILFWGLCFTVEVGKGVIEELFINPTRIVNLASTGDALLTVNRSGELLQWHGGAWEVVVKPQREGPPFAARPPVIGFVYDDARGELVYARRSMGGRFRFLNSGPRLYRVTWTGGAWQQTEAPVPPSGASWVFLDPQGAVDVVASAGVYRLDPGDDDDGQPVPTLFGIPIAREANSAYRSLGPRPPLALEDGFTAAMHPESGDVVLYQSPSLIRLQRQSDGSYRRTPGAKLAIAEGPAALAAAGETIVVAASDGQVYFLDAGSLRPRAVSRPAGKSEPYRIEASADGQTFAALFHDGTLAVYGAEGERIATMGDVSAVAYDQTGRLLVADRATRVTAYELPSLRVAERFAPTPGMLEQVYRYLVVPFHAIFPKPSELGNVVSYLLADRDTVLDGSPLEADIRQSRRTLDVAGPIWSSLAFVIVVLAATCWYVHRVDI